MSKASSKAQEGSAAQVTAEQHRQAVIHEYGQYVAVEPIDHEGVRAYNPGDPVPAANVDKYDYLGRGLVAARQQDDAPEQPQE